MHVQKTADQQIFYIGPDENLTDVRERLEHASAERITLIIPANTQIRGMAAWKLLSAYGREMGIHLTIVSSDASICALARAAHLSVTVSSTSSGHRTRSDKGKGA